ncbi:MAG: hypothetical protein EAY70_03875 [Sphingomonadales bacterium]|nr:MAG: hypothetical protein EAY70_03875 [Sphingomonadales bacterium]
MLIVAGLGNKDNSDGSGRPPEITSLFITDTPNPDDQVIREIRQKMGALEAANCPRDGAFASFFAPPPVAQPGIEATAPDALVPETMLE